MGGKENLFKKKHHLPGDYYNKVHDVPHISQIASSVEDQSHCQDFEGSLDGENDQKVLLRFFLHASKSYLTIVKFGRFFVTHQFLCKLGFISIRKGGVNGEYKTVGWVRIVITFKYLH